MYTPMLFHLTREEALCALKDAAIGDHIGNH